MEAVVEGFARGRGLSLARLDVDSEAALLERYGDEVPVLLINGRKAFKYRVSEAELMKRVRAERRRELARRWRSLLRRAPVK